MIHTLRSAFSDLLEENDWMDDETRTVAREKANAMNEKIGYPEMLTRPNELAKEYENVGIQKEERKVRAGKVVENVYCVGVG